VDDDWCVWEPDSTPRTEMDKPAFNLARAAKAMGHPARIAIIRLACLGPVTCGSLLTEVGLAQATVSQHLKELVDGHFLRREGRAYTLNRSTLDQVTDAIAAIANQR
jgi:DNA-binding transcriptional ArsR family regulator